MTKYLVAFSCYVYTFRRWVVGIELVIVSVIFVVYWYIFSAVNGFGGMGLYGNKLSMLEIISTSV